MFEQWQIKRNEAASSDYKPGPDNLLVQRDLNYWQLCFMVEVHRADRQHYPGCSTDFFVFFGMNPSQITFICSVDVGAINHFKFFHRGSLKPPCHCHSRSTSLHSHHQGLPNQNGLGHIQQAQGLKTVLNTDWPGRTLPWQWDGVNEVQIV